MPVAPGSVLPEGSLQACFECRLRPDCCRKLRVPITHRDLRRLQPLVGAELENRVEWLTPSEIDIEEEQATFLELRKGRRFLVLARQDGSCTFLAPTGRCTVYPLRPSVCAAFPFTVHEGVVELQASAPCALRDDGDLKAYLPVAMRVEAELREYLGLVSQWNRTQRRRRLLRKPLLGAHDCFAFLLRRRD